MKVDLSGDVRIIIRDKDGKIVENFELSSAMFSTLGTGKNKKKTLTLCR